MIIPKSKITDTQFISKVSLYYGLPNAEDRIHIFAIQTILCQQDYEIISRIIQKQLRVFIGNSTLQKALITPYFIIQHIQDTNAFDNLGLATSKQQLMFICLPHFLSYRCRQVIFQLLVNTYVLNCIRLIRAA